MVSGAGPSARYAHTLALVANRFLVAMGGNDGKATLSDAWALDTSEKPYQWKRITDAGDMPSARMYATAAARSDGLLLLCGGRDESGTPLGDAYGLARHRDGRWEWATAPGRILSILCNVLFTLLMVCSPSASSTLLLATHRSLSFFIKTKDVSSQICWF